MAIELTKQSPSLGNSSLGRLFARVRIEQVQDLCEESMMGDKAGDNIDDLQCALQERSQIKSVPQVKSRNRVVMSRSDLQKSAFLPSMCILLDKCPDIRRGPEAVDR
jgi:hypothetical protein